MEAPPKQKQRTGKFARIFALVFLAVGIVVYESVAPSIFSSAAGSHEFSFLRAGVAACLGGFLAWLGLKVGRRFDQR